MAMPKLAGQARRGKSGEISSAARVRDPGGPAPKNMTSVARGGGEAGAFAMEGGTTAAAQVQEQTQGPKPEDLAFARPPQARGAEGPGPGPQPTDAQTDGPLPGDVTFRRLPQDRAPIGSPPGMQTQAQAEGPKPGDVTFRRVPQQR